MGDDARQTIMQGLDKIANAVSVTLGPGGKNVVISKHNHYPHSTKDGVTVAKSIFFTDERDKVGAMMIWQVAEKTAKDVGDGTTTTTVLTQALLWKAYDMLKEGRTLVELKKDMAQCKEIILSEIQKYSVKIDDKNCENFLYNVSMISSNGNLEIAKTVSKAYALAGENGIVQIAQSKENTTSIDHKNGYVISSGYVTDSAINNHQTMSVEFTDCKVLIIADRVKTLYPFKAVLDEVTRKGDKLLIVADEVDNETIGIIDNNKNCCLILGTGIGDMRYEKFYDIGAVTNGFVIDEKKGNTPLGLTYENLGQAKTVSVFKDRTIITSNEENVEIKKRVEFLKGQYNNTDFEYLKESIKERISVLSGGVVRINIGAPTEIEMKEKYDLFEDSVLAAKAALLGGIVPGGGIVLYKIGVLLFKNFGYFDWISSALMVPSYKIIENLGFNDEEKSNYRDALSSDSKKEVYCFNSKEIYPNFIEKGICDPTNVLNSCIENSFSLVSTILSTESLIIPETIR